MVLQIWCGLINVVFVEFMYVCELYGYSDKKKRLFNMPVSVLSIMPIPDNEKCFMILTAYWLSEIDTNASSEMYHCLSSNLWI